MDLSILINWTSQFQILGVPGILFHFYSVFDRNSCYQTVQTLVGRRDLRRLIWVCTVCLCPKNGTLGFNLTRCWMIKTAQSRQSCHKHQLQLYVQFMYSLLIEMSSLWPSFTFYTHTCKLHEKNGATTYLQMIWLRMNMTLQELGNVPAISKTPYKNAQPLVIVTKVCLTIKTPPCWFGIQSASQCTTFTWKWNKCSMMIWQCIVVCKIQTKMIEVYSSSSMH